MGRQTKSDLVIMDLQLPETDGLLATASLKALLKLAAIPVVGVSSCVSAADRDRAFAAGRIDYSERPIDPDTFGTRVVGILQSVRRTTP